MNKVIVWVIGIVAFVALVIGSVALVGGNQSAATSAPTVGAGTRFPNGIAVGSGASVTTGTALTIGSNGDALSSHEFNTCTPVFSSADLAATTTAIGICTDSSFATSDKVQVMQKFTGAVTGFPTSGGNGMFPSLTVIATTTGQFGIQVINFTGAATTSINSIYRTYSYQLER